LWTAEGYWYSTDGIFRARPGTSTLTGPTEQINKCAPVKP
jgi:hypothetical protein